MNEYERSKAWDQTKVSALMKGSYFITTIGFSLRLEWTTKIPTAATDGLTLLFNPDYYDSLSKEERLFIYLHEVWHVAFMHMLRVGDKNKLKYNQAADHLINLMLITQGYQMPSGGLADSAYTGMSTEQIYDLLPNPPEDSDYDMDIRIPSLGEDGEETPTEAHSEALKAAIEDLVLRATKASEMSSDKPGTIPEDIGIALKKLINPVLPWGQLLINYMDAYTKNDYSWRKPNRRLLNTAYLPSLYSESIENVTICVDTSCSVEDHQFTAFISEIAYMRELFPIDLMPVISFDTSIKNVDILKAEDSIADISFQGRGGTDLREVYAYLNKNTANLTIIFSDLEVDIPPKKFAGDILFICVDNPSRKVSYGTLIHYSTEGKR